MRLHLCTFFRMASVILSSLSLPSMKGKHCTLACLAVSMFAASVLLARRSTAFANRQQQQLRPAGSVSRDAKLRQMTRNSEEEDDEKDTERPCSMDQTTVRPRRRATLEDELTASNGQLVVRPIGVVRSVYRLCVGTPRQGLLAPHARARIELSGVPNGSLAAVEGLEQFSHVWIVFVFHLNTVGGKQQSKIAPPALGGVKVGVLATRSPHRFNPIGLTLAKLDRIRTIERTVEGRKKSVSTTVLDISGTDLVDGTPVLDIKPYVPNYDAPPSDSFTASTGCHVPEWVSEGLATARSVQLTPVAEHELRDILQTNPMALEFYGHDESVEDAIVAVSACIQEILSMDVRSRYQTQKARRGLSQAERSDRMQLLPSGRVTPHSGDRDDDQRDQWCTQQIDNLLIYFDVQPTSNSEREASTGSGAEDTVVVHSIQLIGR
jgi:tRNA (adenine37-N6)-methyltransferase